MDLRRLRSFAVLAEELHFGRAARRLNMSQPPLSRQIALLEQEVGTLLLRRTRRRVELTPAGTVFLERIRALLQGLDDSVDEAKRVARGEVGRLTLGMVESAAYSVLPRIVRAFSDRHPAVRLGFRSITTTDQIDALHSGRIDIGLVRIPARSDGIAVHPLMVERFVVALGADHPLAGRKRLSLRQLADEPFLITPREEAVGFYDDIVGLCQRAGFTPRIAHETRPFATLIGLVGAGLGIAVVPESMRQISVAEVVYRSLSDADARTAFALASREREPSPIVHRFIAIAQEAVRRGARG
jgi:DNA-binding transcriptional LysR family regulator